MKKEYKVGDLVKGSLVTKATDVIEYQNKIGVVVDTMIAETGFIYRVHYGGDYGLFWQAPSQIKPLWVDK